jgi:hypothetical protein
MSNPNPLTKQDPAYAKRLGKKGAKRSPWRKFGLLKTHTKKR